MTTVTIHDAFLIGSDHTITVTGVKDEAGTLVTGATFTGVLYDRAGTAVASDITFAEVTADTYKATLGDEIALVEDQQYRLIATAVKADKKLTLRIKRPAKYVEG